MSSPSQVAAGFTITGLLDGASRTRGRYPVSEIAVADIADHPANAAYSMDPAGIAELAESIRADGLTDLPLVRKVSDGSWQMVSGHRRRSRAAPQCGHTLGSGSSKESPAARACSRVMSPARSIGRPFLIF